MFTLRLTTTLLMAVAILSGQISCRKTAPQNEASPSPAHESQPPNETSVAVKADIPILPLTKDDHWIYDVTVTIPEGVRFEKSPADEKSFERKRTYIGKVKPSPTLPETDCFEMTAPNAPVEREYVDITDDKVVMRGSSVAGFSEIEPFWLDPGVLLVRAGLLGGESLPPVKFNDPKTKAERMRYIQIVGREPIRAAGKTFDTIRILMTGTDGGFELRRTIWFAPRHGIINEEKARYISNKLVIREATTLKSYSVKNAH